MCCLQKQIGTLDTIAEGNAFLTHWLCMKPCEKLYFFQTISIVCYAYVMQNITFNIFIIYIALLIMIS